LVLGDLGDLAFFGDSRVFLGDLGLETLAAFAFLGEVASFFGLDGAFFVAVVEAFFVAVFFVPTFLDGDLVPVPAFFDVEVDLFFVVFTVDEDDEVEDPEVDGAVVVVAFFVDFFFFLSPLSPGASL